jgi:hypothetical protein
MALGQFMIKMPTLLLLKLGTMALLTFMGLPLMAKVIGDKCLELMHLIIKAYFPNGNVGIGTNFSSFNIGCEWSI